METTDLQGLLCCPACRGGLLFTSPTSAYCAGCRLEYPILDGIPLLIDESRSVFTLEHLRGYGETYFRHDAFAEPTRLRRLADRILPSITSNIAAERNFRQLVSLLAARPGRKRVLIVGGGVVGQGVHHLLADSRLDVIESDVAFGPRTRLICDAHRLPFRDGSLDAVVAQVVLEHVVDPYTCVDEFHRVLSADGLVYAETPLMQQVHGGRFDFTRFTHLGHRRLFRRFDEIDSGAAMGPGTALAWAWCYYLVAFTKRRLTRDAAIALGRATAGWFALADARISQRPEALDAASQLYFLGRRSDRVLSDHELLEGYRGGYH